MTLNHIDLIAMIILVIVLEVRYGMDFDETIVSCLIYIGVKFLITLTLSM